MTEQGKRMRRQPQKRPRAGGSRKRWILGACGAVIIAGAAGLFCWLGPLSGGAVPESGTGEMLTGSWSYGAYTRYTFDPDGTGSMWLEEMEFPYQYRLEGDQLYLDFESNKLMDAAYTCTMEGDTLTIQGGQGTTGGTYELSRTP